MTLLQLLTFLYYHAELTVWLGLLFLAILYVLERVITNIITMPATLAKEKTKQLTTQLTTQLEIEKLRQSKPKQDMTPPESTYDQGYQTQVME